MDPPPSLSGEQRCHSVARFSHHSDHDRILDRVPNGMPFISLAFFVRILEGVGAASFLTASYTIMAGEFPDRVATTFVSVSSLHPNDHNECRYNFLQSCSGSAGDLLRTGSDPGTDSRRSAVWGSRLHDAFRCPGNFPAARRSHCLLRSPQIRCDDFSSLFFLSLPKANAAVNAFVVPLSLPKSTNDSAALDSRS